MSTFKKRPATSREDVSPPPLKRKAREVSLPQTGSNLQPTSAAAQPGHVRIFSWNVNGIGPFLQKSISSYFGNESTSPIYSLRRVLQRNQWPQMLCLQEVKINPNDDATKRSLERAANGDGRSDTGPAYTAYYCLPQDKYNAKGFGGKVYGVATFIRDDFLDQVKATREVSWDQEGRVLVTELQNKLVTINGYWVNGTENFLKDSSSGEVIGTRHDRKRTFHKLMLEECQEYEKRGLVVILVGDMNVARGPLDGYPGIRMGTAHVVNRADFNAKFFLDDNGLKAIDAFRHIHGNRRKYSYYGRNHEWGTSCDRVDLIILSRKIVEKSGLLVDTDILDTAEDRGHSDHVPLYITLDMRRLDS